MVLVFAVTGTGAVLSPPVAGWFAAAASPDLVWTAETTESGVKSDWAGMDESSAAGEWGWESCGEALAPGVV